MTTAMFVTLCVIGYGCYRLVYVVQPRYAHYFFCGYMLSVVIHYVR